MYHVHSSYSGMRHASSSALVLHLIPYTSLLLRKHSVCALSTIPNINRAAAGASVAGSLASAGVHARRPPARLHTLPAQYLMGGSIGPLGCCLPLTPTQEQPCLCSLANAVLTVHHSVCCYPKSGVGVQAAAEAAAAGGKHLEGLVAHKDVPVQREADLPALEEALVGLRVPAVCTIGSVIIGGAGARALQPLGCGRCMCHAAWSGTMAQTAVSGHECLSKVLQLAEIRAARHPGKGMQGPAAKVARGMQTLSRPAYS